MNIQPLSCPILQEWILSFITPKVTLLLLRLRTKTLLCHVPCCETKDFWKTTNTGRNEISQCPLQYFEVSMPSTGAHKRARVSLFARAAPYLFVGAQTRKIYGSAHETEEESSPPRAHSLIASELWRAKSGGWKVSSARANITELLPKTYYCSVWLCAHACGLLAHREKTNCVISENDERKLQHLSRHCAKSIRLMWEGISQTNLHRALHEFTLNYRVDQDFPKTICPVST